MSVLEKVKILPPEKQQEVEDFVEYLLHKYGNDLSRESVAETRIRNLGWAKGTIWVAPDFDDTPEDFKDYL